ncbi:hypothetical protein KIH07_16920 [Hydrogenophaga taeniospiralis]|uniref:hypothetical protein n=1 Tax=Hydrogenophaga taeniospiralis TaxID=65656 RepID=UPI001CFBC0A8|nr:hypothetical protein [Hydrogenophaga taeniospiralis]MCB4365428.1 hypothetical protein [Hydrogenophaga taeniospiralis]
MSHPTQHPRRAELLRRIDAAEFAAMQQPAKVAPVKRLSEGTRSAQAIQEGLRTGAIRQQPAPQPQHRPMTADRYLLRDNAPTLRAVRELDSLGEHYRAACRRVDAALPTVSQSAHDRLAAQKAAAEELDRSRRRRTHVLLAVYFAALAALLFAAVQKA